VVQICRGRKLPSGLAIALTKKKSQAQKPWLFSSHLELLVLLHQNTRAEANSWLWGKTAVGLAAHREAGAYPITFLGYCFYNS